MSVRKRETILNISTDNIEIDQIGVGLKQSLLGEHTEKTMAPHSSALAWEVPWTEGPGGLQSMGLLGVRHN